MSSFAFSLVLSAAILHAIWNAVVKSADDRMVVLASVSLAHAVVGLALVTSVPMPASESWPYIIASTLIHFVYYGFLLLAYRLGDLSQVYPISRGIAPMLVALGAFFFAAESLPILGWLAVTLVSAGIAALVIGGGNQAQRGAVLAAFATGLMIASYSVVDGIGVRMAGSPFAYMGWLFLLEFPVIIFVMWLRRTSLGSITVRTVGLGFLGGVCATTAYGLVLFAKTIAPLAAVSAVRESSVVIAALIGVCLFGERPWVWRFFCALIVASGVVLLALSPTSGPSH